MKSVQKRAEQEPRGASASAREGEAFSRSVLAVHRELDLEAQLRVLLEVASGWCGATFGVALVPSVDHPLLVPLVATVEDEEDPRRQVVPPLALTRMRKSGEYGVRAHEGLGPLADRRAWPGEEPACSVVLSLADPGASVAGLLWLALARRPDPETLERLEALGEEVAPALGNALRVRSLRELVIKDDTAHCFNRRYFEEFLPEELARATRFRSPLSLIFLDMDNLKQVNNRYGHAVGSRTLRELSVRVRGRIRKFDKLFRFGGDEFCIVLPETPWHGALEVAERIRDAIDGTPFLAPDLNKGRGIRMSASLGIASFPLHARTEAELIERADRAMQTVKKGGKNAIGISGIDEGHDASGT